MYRDQNHDFMFNSSEVMRRNATKSWKLAAILDLAAILIFLIGLLDTRTKIVLYTFTLKVVLKTKLLHKAENIKIPIHVPHYPSFEFTR